MLISGPTLRSGTDSGAGRASPRRGGHHREHDVVRQPVGAGRHQRTDHPAQPGDLRPDGHGVVGVAVQRAAQVARRSAPPGRPAPAARRISACRPVSGARHGSSVGPPEDRAPGRSSRGPDRPRGARGPHQPAARRAARAGTAPRPGTATSAVGPRHGDPVADRDPGVVGHPAVVVDEQQRSRTPARTPRRRCAAARGAAGGGATAGSRPSRTAVSTRAPIAGCRVSAGPLTSTTPSSSPVRGSWMGAAVQYHGCCCLLEVLGGEQLHRRGLGQRGADRVGAHHPLGPHGPLAEAEPVGAQPHPGGPLAPEDHAVGVGDDHEEARGVRDADRAPGGARRRPAPAATYAGVASTSSLGSRSRALTRYGGEPQPTTRDHDRVTSARGRTGGRAAAEHRVVHADQVTGRAARGRCRARSRECRRAPHRRLTHLVATDRHRRARCNTLQPCSRATRAVCAGSPATLPQETP